MNIDELLKEISLINSYSLNKQNSKEHRRLITKLIKEDLITRQPLNNKYLKLTDLGNKALDVGYDNLINAQKTDRELVKNKELIDYELARLTLQEFPKTKRRAQASLVIAIILAVLQLIQWIISLK